MKDHTSIHNFMNCTLHMHICVSAHMQLHKCSYKYMDIQVYNCIFFFNLLLFAKRGLLTEEICLNRYLAFLLQENHSTLMQSVLWSSRGRLPITPCDQIIAEQVYCNWRWQKEISWADELFFCWVENLCRQILWPTMPQSWQCGEDSFSSPRNGCETPPWPQLLAHCLVGTAVLQDVFWSLPSVTTLKVGWICSTYLFTIIQMCCPSWRQLMMSHCWMGNQQAWYPPSNDPISSESVLEKHVGLPTVVGFVWSRSWLPPLARWSSRQHGPESQTSLSILPMCINFSVFL